MVENITLGQIASAIGILGVIIGAGISIYKVIKKADDDRKALQKSINDKDNIQSEALMILLQSNLTNTFFAYEKLGEIPYYIYKNWLSELKVYENLGGDDFVHILAEKMETFKIIYDEK